jgi:hypothetical protein
VIYVAEQKKIGNFSIYTYRATGPQKVRKRRSFDLNSALMPGTGTIYSFEFGIGSKDKNLASLHYIGLTVQSPSYKRIKEHGTEAKTGLYRLDYLAFGSALYNTRPGAENISSIDQMVKIINIVSFFDLALMETFYINYEEKTRDPQDGLGNSTYKNFDEVLKSRGYSKDGKLKPNIKIGLNSGKGGEGDPVKQRATPTDVNSRRLTPAEVIIAAAMFLEDSDPHDEGSRDVIKARKLLFPSGWENNKIDSALKSAGIKKDKLKDADYFAEKIRYIISWFKEQGGLDNSQVVETKDNLFSLKGVMAPFFNIDINYVKSVLNSIGYNTTTKFTFSEKEGVNYKQKFSKPFAEALGILYPSDTSSNAIVPGFTSQAILSMVTTQSFPELLNLTLQLNGSPSDKKSKEAIKTFRKEFGKIKKDTIDSIVLAMVNENIEIVNNMIKSSSKKIQKMNSSSLSSFIKAEQASYIKKNPTKKVTDQTVQAFKFNAYKKYIEDVIEAAEKAGIILTNDQKDIMRSRVLQGSYLSNLHFAISK